MSKAVEAPVKWDENVILTKIQSYDFLRYFATSARNWESKTSESCSLCMAEEHEGVENVHGEVQPPEG